MTARARLVARGFVLIAVCLLALPGALALPGTPAGVVLSWLAIVTACTGAGCIGAGIAP